MCCRILPDCWRVCLPLLLACAIPASAAAQYVSEEFSGEDEGRKTLLVWNSGAEQTGGPPGWDEPLASDRPDFTEASCTVGRGVCQLEMGYTYFHDSDAASSLNA